MSILYDGNTDGAGLISALQKGHVKAALLLEMQFVSETVRASNWNVTFEDSDGVEWLGMGDLVGMSDISGGENLSPFREYTLGLPKDMAGYSDARVPELVGHRSDYLNQSATLRMQVFDTDVVDVHGRPSPIGSPIALDFGIMSGVSTTYSATAANVTLMVEGGLSRKSRKTPTFYTDRDQQRLYPGDLGCGFVAEVSDTELQMTDW